MRLPGLLIVGGGGAMIAAAFLADRKAKAAVAATASAVASGGSFKVHATGYWPYQEGLSARARLMEGAPVDRRAPAICKTSPNDSSCVAHALHTVEDFFSGKSDHVSVSGDPAIFPFGQKILVDWFGRQLVGRVTDTGGHFFGAGKVYRVMGEEPLDFCVASSATPVPKEDVVAVIVVGDTLDKSGKAVATGKFQGQSVAGLAMLGLDVFAARSKKEG